MWFLATGLVSLAAVVVLPLFIAGLALQLSGT